MVTGSPGFIGANLVMRLLNTLSSGTVVSFDNASKKFYVTVPSESVLTLRRIERIDAAALDRLTEEVLGA